MTERAGMSPHGWRQKTVQRFRGALTISWNWLIPLSWMVRWRRSAVSPRLRDRLVLEVADSNSVDGISAPSEATVRQTAG